MAFQISAENANCLNYRHSFHAGNFADVLKHIALVATLKTMQKKDAGLFVLDAFAGRGVYDLHSTEAARSPEYLAGIVKIWDANLVEKLPEAMKHYLAVLSEATTSNERFYAGSPLFISQMLRDQDRALFNELHLEEKAFLDAAISQFSLTSGKKRIKTSSLDGYLAIKANLPPLERRGLIVIDPPFEIAGEFERMVLATKQGLKRFATGVFLLWHADKDEKAVRRYHHALSELGKEVLSIELRVSKEDGTSGLKAAGISIVNPPFGVETHLEEAKSAIVKLLRIGEGAKMTIRHLF